ncbi:vesicle transport through interaction with t-SNAREs homolog 1A [Condylostylus longicornis]|uniref:vesicle transport through interaction with t-SNAREs homolog 1A n=1 Tax=Condylostylus longicornis TaxID=2530218 RepID=UPI00244DDAC6|nr:vesicle transport through interaction with t-SNAREs homolog 1A [Condylostylus longicornis]
MSLIEQYEQQYSALIGEITANIGRINIYNTSGARKELGTKIDASLAEAEELLEQIGLEIRDQDPAARNILNNKYKCYQAELKRLADDFKKTKDIARQGTAFDLIDDNDDVVISDDQKQRLLDNSERIERTGNRLTEGYRIVLETEQIGNQVLQDLHHQRETIENTRSKIRETNADLGRSSRTLNSIMMRALREKCILYGVGVIFLIIVTISIYFSISSSKN